MPIYIAKAKKYLANDRTKDYFKGYCGKIPIFGFFDKTRKNIMHFLVKTKEKDIFFGKTEIFYKKGGMKEKFLKGYFGAIPVVGLFDNTETTIYISLDVKEINFKERREKELLKYSKAVE